MEKKIYVDAEGKEILLNEVEKKQVETLQNALNDLGYGDIDLNILATIDKRVSTQKFYEVDPSQYIPIVTDVGAFGEFITTFRSFVNGDNDIEQWEIGQAGENSRRNQQTVAMQPVSIPLHKLAQMISYDLIELRQATLTGVWNVIEEKERSRMRRYQLAIQKMLLNGGTRYAGLLNLDQFYTGMTVDTTTIPAPIGQMNNVQFKLFLNTVFAKYVDSTDYTQLPDTFVIPFTWYLGMLAATDETYPLKSMGERLDAAFKEVTGNANAKILPLAYANGGKRGGTARCVMYKREFDTIRAYNPITYSVVQGASIDGFNFQNTAYAQISDVFVNRPKEVMYFETADAA